MLPLSAAETEPSRLCRPLYDMPHSQAVSCIQSQRPSFSNKNVKRDGLLMSLAYTPALTRRAQIHRHPRQRSVLVLQCHKRLLTGFFPNGLWSIWESLSLQVSILQLYPSHAIRLYWEVELLSLWSESARYVLPVGEVINVVPVMTFNKRVTLLIFILIALDFDVYIRLQHP